MRIIDLTLDIYEGMTTPPCDWHPRTEITILGRHGLEGRMSRKITVGSHTGTHVDAPLHIFKDGLSVDQLPLETLVGKARLIDMSQKGKGELQGITTDELEHFDIKEGERIIIRTDWSDKWDTPAYYTKRPYIEADAIEWLAKRVSLLGLDICAPGDPREGFLERGVPPADHIPLFEHGVILVEYLTNLKAISKDYFTFIALPLKVRGGDGAPARVVAIED